MSTVNEFLNQHYSTTAPSIEKTAGELSDDSKIAIFAKIAAENGINLLDGSVDDAKLEDLFNETFAKEAGEMPPQFAKKNEKKEPDEEGDEKKKAEKDEKEKKAAAEAEFLQKKAAQERFEESDFCGRVMAHSYVNEMRKIAATCVQVEAAVVDKTAAAAPTESLRDRLLKIASKDDKPEEKKDEKKDDDKDGKKEKSLPPWMKDKEASAFEQVAVEHAMSLLADHNKTAEQAFDIKVAADRLAAVATLGLSETEKVASAANAEIGTHIRALEYLEAAGYPVNWGG